MNRDEAVKKIAKEGYISIEHAEELYDSIVTKPVVPQYVADWYEEHKDEFYLNLHRVVRYFFEHFNENPNAIQILVNMHQFGYEVEKEPKYTVRIKGIAGSGQYLNKNLQNKNWFIGLAKTMVRYTFKHTRKELEESGFGWVFDCEGIEVTEVE